MTVSHKKINYVPPPLLLLPPPPPLSSCVFAIKLSSGQNQLRHCLHRRRANTRLLGVTLQLRGLSIRGPNGGPWSPPSRLMAISGGGASLSVHQVYGPRCAVIGGSYFPSVAADLPFSLCLTAARGAAFTRSHRARLAQERGEGTLTPTGHTETHACYAA